MTAVYVIGFLCAIGLIALLLTVGIGWIVKLFGRATHLDRRVDDYFEHSEGAMTPEEYLKFKEQHPHGGRG